MRVRFLLGPAGCGKTYRCLAEVRRALGEAADGPPLILLAPKQATFQLERQLLGEESIPGYSRLHILSFDRLAYLIFDRVRHARPNLLSEEGRIMVLRALLASERSSLQLFRASARLPGFASQLSEIIRELQQHRVSASRLSGLALQVGPAHRLNHKLHDLALLWSRYESWLADHGLEDAHRLLDAAAAVLEPHRERASEIPTLFGGRLWLDGFSQMTPQERRLLRAVIPFCAEATLAFCLESEPAGESAWYSPWAVIGRTYHQCRGDAEGLAGCEVAVEVMARDPARSRFEGGSMLAHLERHWADPRPDGRGAGERDAAVRTLTCSNPEAEAVAAARGIWQYARSGGRYRDVAVMVRHLDGYHDTIRRVFTRYEIPFFMDRREGVAHHPLAELTRNAVRMPAFHWRHDDFFAALKSGLAAVSEREIDELENRALERGWEGASWARAEGREASDRVGSLARRARRPFLDFETAIGPCPNGGQLAEGLRGLWETLGIGGTLEDWSRPRKAGEGEEYHPIHATVWDQMHAWLENLAMAFSGENLTLAEWLPVLESGLAGLTVGVIPPVLDQVLVGAIDRSRNPDLRRVYLLGVNETVFPAPPAAPVLLTDPDRARLEEQGMELGPGSKLRLGHERFYGYIACTRARDQVVLTRSLRDERGRVLNPSVFHHHLTALFPDLTDEPMPPVPDWREAEHACEVVTPLLLNRTRPETERDPALNALSILPSLTRLADRMANARPANLREGLSQESVRRLYGDCLNTSVSRIEQFAACPFRFFVNSGLRVEERKRFELDIRRQGMFQHEVLAEFHRELAGEGLRWRDLKFEEARERLGAIAERLMGTFEDGILVASGRNRFLARTYQTSLQRFLGVVYGWMEQNEFDPAAVEAGFGLRDGSWPAWTLEVSPKRRLQLSGRIDRVDVWRDPSGDDIWCVVVDYKSGQRKLDRVLVRHGIQQQLLAYLNVLRRLPDPARSLGAGRLRPGGVFYVALRGLYAGGAHRNEVLSDLSDADQKAYQHRGVFCDSIRARLDNRPGVLRGDQFAYQVTKDGRPFRNRFALMEDGEFLQLLEDQERLLASMGRRIFDGEASVDPWKRKRETACDQCEYRSICRIDPWTHGYRPLESEAGEEEA